MRLSIIIPVYNEEKTIEIVLRNLLSIDFGIEKELIVIDDGSRDDSKRIIENFIKEHSKSEKSRISLFAKKNGGKGTAIRAGLERCSGDIITIQDADLEYDPNEFRNLIAPIMNNQAKVVYGSRFLSNHEPLYRIYYLGNKFLTLLTQILYGARITDMETCYKVFRSDVIKSIHLKAEKFDFEPEVTAKILKSGIKIIEIPISYKPRSIEEGKKIGWKDGIQAIYTLLYYRIFS